MYLWLPIEYRIEQKCESMGGNVNMQAVSNTKYWK